MAEVDPAADEEFIKSLAKGLAVIESFGPDFPEMTLVRWPGATASVLVRRGACW